MTSPRPASILTISLTRHLTGRDVNDLIEESWSPKNVAASTASQFNNVGFNLDVADIPANLKELNKKINEKDWDGFLLAWCVRGHAEFTELFEAVVAQCCDYVAEKRKTSKMEPKLIFNSGPQDLVNATLRNFPDV